MRWSLILLTILSSFALSVLLAFAAPTPNSVNSKGQEGTLTNPGRFSGAGRT